MKRKKKETIQRSRPQSMSMSLKRKISTSSENFIRNKISKIPRVI